MLRRGCPSSAMVVHAEACLSMLRHTCPCSEVLPHAQALLSMVRRGCLCSGVLVDAQVCLSMLRGASPCSGMVVHTQAWLSVLRRAGPSSGRLSMLRVASYAQDFIPCSGMLGQGWCSLRGWCLVLLYSHLLEASSPLNLGARIWKW